MRKNVPIDVLQCTHCGHVVTQEDWVPPLAPLLPGRCTNCCNRRDFTGCVNCGLTRDEDVQVHDELRHMVAPELNHLDAARKASREGRRLIALKLATCAAAINEEDKGDVARALRVWLLSAIGEPQHALEDAKAWVENQQDPSAMAWASYGQQLQHGAFPGAAADAYHRTLLKDPYQHTIRAKRAQLLLQLHREGQALDEMLRVYDNAKDDETAIKIATEVAEELCGMFEKQNRDDEVTRVLARGEAFVGESAILLAHRARLAALAGDTSQAKRDLKRARKLDPELEIYERVESAMRPARGSWWRW